MTTGKSIPSVSVTYARNGVSTRSNELVMRPMQERAWEKRGEQYLLIKSPPASGKSRALMFIALDKVHNQDLRQAIIVVPEKAIGASFNDETRRDLLLVEGGPDRNRGVESSVQHGAAALGAGLQAPGTGGLFHSLPQTSFTTTDCHVNSLTMHNAWYKTSVWSLSVRLSCGPLPGRAR